MDRLECVRGPPWELALWVFCVEITKRKRHFPSISARRGWHRASEISIGRRIFTLGQKRAHKISGKSIEPNAKVRQIKLKLSPAAGWAVWDKNAGMRERGAYLLTRTQPTRLLTINGSSFFERLGTRQSALGGTMKCARSRRNSFFFLLRLCSSQEKNKNIALALVYRPRQAGDGR